MNLYELFIGFKYLKSKKGYGIISLNTVLSIIIVAVGIFSMIVVYSIYSGMETGIKDKILDIDSHISVKNYNFNRAKGVSDYNEIRKKTYC